MDGRRYDSYELGPLSEEEGDTARGMSIEQLRYLVDLLDHSDVSELELRRADEGISLVLRKVQGVENEDQRTGMPTEVTLVNSLLRPMTVPAETKHTIVASLVGIFHRWSKPRGKTLVSIGDRVKAGQYVAAIESLAVINEVESPVAGRVVEILVQEGQPIEYGQPLMTIDSAGEA